jgi:hypothetical protein
MKRIAVAAAAVLLLLGFYVAWPAWSGYAIRSALQNKDAPALAAKVDFESVQASMRPVVTQKVLEGYDRYQTQLGPTGGLVLGQLKKDTVPRIVEASLKSLLTPEMIVRIASEAGPIKEAIDRIMREQMARAVPGGEITNASGDTGGGPLRPGLGGLLGKALKGGDQTAKPAPAAEPVPAAKPIANKFSLTNIKSFAFTSPLSFQVGVAKDPATPDADVTVQMSFIGGDWKVTGLVPRP